MSFPAFQGPESWSSGLPLVDPLRAGQKLQHIARTGVPRDLFASLLEQLKQHIARLSDPDMAVNNLARFFESARSPLALSTLFQRDPTAMPILLKIFSTSQFLSDLLITDPESYDALRLTEGQPIAQVTVTDELSTELAGFEPNDVARAKQTLRRFKQREVLRIAYGDIVGQQELDTISRQLSYLADAMCQGALDFAHRRLQQKFGTPRSKTGLATGFVALACGKLGGLELNYSSDIDLILVYQAEGETDGQRSTSNRNYFETMARDMVRLLTESTREGMAYRVDLRLRPGGQTAPMVISFAGAVSYYDLRGRTWERQALVKARPIAGIEGDLSLGRQLLERLAPWIFGQRLSVADIASIRALKLRIEHKALVGGEDECNVKTGRGGIRDIEFALQFLQLLHGHDLPNLRTGNTLDALSQLYQTDCITSQEHSFLEHGYRWLRRLEHLLQIMFDLQTHSIPNDPHELRKVALRMEYVDRPGKTALDQFKSALHDIRERNRAILDHLLHGAFGCTNGDGVPPEVSLILDPNPTDEWIEEVLGKYGFARPIEAHDLLIDLATEKNVFLSHRRCRHFLAAIAAPLLREIAGTPNPDDTLRTLEAVSESLGGKAALWELFRTHQPTLQLYVTLCAASSYLSKILIRNPGMIDGLLDSLILQELPSFEFLDRLLQDRLRRAEEAAPIIHRFKNDQHLRVGVRDILGRDCIDETHRTLADVAELCLREVATREFSTLAARCGTPKLVDGRDCELLILAMGKLGGREPNYHSDLDVVFLFGQDGNTTSSGIEASTSNQDFFSRLAAQITKQIATPGRYGKLYEIDGRLRPTGKSGSLAVSLNEFRRYFAQGDGQLWERLALCKARPVFGSNAARQSLLQDVHTAIAGHPWEPKFAMEIADMRARMEEGSSPRNIKRGPGGTVDLEFVVQLLQLKHSKIHSTVLIPGTLKAAAKLYDLNLLGGAEYQQISTSYRLLRSVEARIRLLDSVARHDLPEEPDELAKLAYLLRYEDPDLLLEDVDVSLRTNRELFKKMIDVHGQ